MDPGDSEAEGGELGGLIIHERDERADDERGPAAGEGWELVAETLAGSSGHDEQDIATGGSSLAYHLLVCTEVAVTEDAVEKLGEGLGWVERGHVLRFIFACPTRAGRGLAWFAVNSSVDSKRVPSPLSGFLLLVGRRIAVRWQIFHSDMGGLARAHSQRGRLRR